MQALSTESSKVGTPRKLSASHQESLTVFLEKLMEVEARSGKSAATEFIETASAKIQELPEFHKYCVAFYARAGKPNQALEAYGNYLRLCDSRAVDKSAVEMAIQCAYHLSQHHLVWDFFRSLSATLREELSAEILLKITSSAVLRGKYTEAERLSNFIRTKAGYKPLSDFDDYLRAEFGSTEQIGNFISRNRAIENSNTLDDIAQLMKYAMALISQNQYAKAEQVLLKYRSAVAA